MDGIFNNYQLDDSVSAELNNNLTIMNAILENREIQEVVDLYILGGAALSFHGLQGVSTLDIDTANKIHPDIKHLIDEFVDDASSEVSLLPDYYMNRAVRIRRDLTKIDTYILSLEDILITKLYCGRRKDFNSIKMLKLDKLIDIETVKRIMFYELASNKLEALKRCINAYVCEIDRGSILKLLLVQSVLDI